MRKYLSCAVFSQNIDYRLAVVCLRSQLHVVPVVRRNGAEKAVELGCEFHGRDALRLPLIFLLENYALKVRAEQIDRRFVELPGKGIRGEVVFIWSVVILAPQLLRKKHLRRLQKEPVLRSHAHRVLLQRIGAGRRDPVFDKRGIEGVIYFEYLKVLEIFPNRVHRQDFLPEAFISNPVGTAGYLLAVKLFGVNLARPASVAVACRSDGDQRVNAAKKISLGTLKDFVIDECRSAHPRHQATGLVSTRKHRTRTPRPATFSFGFPDLKKGAPQQPTANDRAHPGFAPHLKSHITAPFSHVLFV